LEDYNQLLKNLPIFKRFFDGVINSYYIKLN